MQEAKFSTNFKMFRGKTEFLHTARSEETPDRHLEDVIKYVEACVGHGFHDEPRRNGDLGLEENEKDWPVDGYIVGLAKDNRGGPDEYCVWLYGRGEYKTATAYNKRWDRLSFIPDTSQVLHQYEAPRTADARTKREFIKLPPSIAVLSSYVSTKDGKTRWAFERMIGDSGVKPPAAEPPVTSAASGEAAKLAETIVSGVQTGATTPQLLVSFGERAMLRRPEVGTEWARVQNVFRSKLVPMRYQFPRDVMLDSIEKLRQLLGEVYYADLMSSFAEGDSDVPF